jgi:hypothetical protein
MSSSYVIFVCRTFHFLVARAQRSVHFTDPTRQPRPPSTQDRQVSLLNDLSLFNGIKPGPRHANAAVQPTGCPICRLCQVYPPGLAVCSGFPPLCKRSGTTRVSGVSRHDAGFARIIREPPWRGHPPQRARLRNQARHGEPDHAIERAAPRQAGDTGRLIPGKRDGRPVRSGAPRCTREVNHIPGCRAGRGPGACFPSSRVPGRGWQGGMRPGCSRFRRVCPCRAGPGAADCFMITGCSPRYSR